MKDFLASGFTNLIALNVSIISLLCAEAQPWNLTIPYCKIRTYIMNVSLQMSRFIILAACFDRYALCSTNAYRRKFCHVRIARQYVIPSIIFIWLIIPLHIPIHTTIINHDCVLTGAFALYNSIYHIIFIGIIPHSLMFIFSILTFRNLKARQRRRQIYPFMINAPVPSINENRRPQIKDEQVFAMLLVQVLAYVISSTPYTIIQLYIVLDMNTNYNELDGHEIRISFISFITDMLRFVCPFTSFYLFILVSRLYRKEMKLILLNIYHKFNLLWGGNNNNNQRHRNSTITHNSGSIRLNERRQQRQTGTSRNIIPNETVQ